ncbi:MAG: UDP-N-acetylglucosamine 2-epimerase (non-hydrolyzing) [Patescibacteria group bacterium]
MPNKLKDNLKIIFVAGARPNFMKIAPLMAQFKRQPRIKSLLVHTGQHYDKKMSRVFFDDLKIPKPNVNLGVGSGTQAEQTGKILIEFDKILEREKPDLVVVVGDVNSTVACSLAAAKRGIKVAHVEAGLRSFDWTMPEEINRVLTDKLSDLLFCTEGSAVKNLRAEGIAKSKIFFVGNVMIDTLLANKKLAEKSRILADLKLTGKKYAVLTLHRPSNVDDKKNLGKLITTVQKIAKKIPVVFPVHPRTQKNMAAWKISGTGINIIQPLGYLDFLKLMSDAQMVLTDSGGIQEETTILGVPCLTLRQNTERPVTVKEGTNQVIGMDEKKILAAVSKILKEQVRKKRIPKFWDGKAAQRIAKIIINNLCSKHSYKKAK